MYEMVTGIPPYSRGDHMSVMYQHVQGKAKLCQEINPNVPDSYAERYQRIAMSVDKSKRYAVDERTDRRNYSIASSCKNVRQLTGSRGKFRLG